MAAATTPTDAVPMRIPALLEVVAALSEVCVDLVVPEAAEAVPEADESAVEDVPAEVLPALPEPAAPPLSAPGTAVALE